MSQPPAFERNTSPAYEYDVFISYSRKDKAWVRGELATRLRQAGLKTCIDVEDFRAGAPTIQEIERAVNISKKTLLIITPNYIASEWTEFERYLLQTTDPTNKDFRILPLRYEHCDLPRSVRYLSYIDFTDPEEIDLAWRQLFRAFGIDLSDEQADNEQPPQWRLVHPYAMPPHFTGRAAERQMLSQWLNEDTQHPLMVLRALGGFGKSALTWHWLLNDVDKRRWPRVVWWSFYEAQAGFDNFLATTLGYLMGQEPKEIVKAINSRERVDALLNYLQQPGTLLVLDGYERELRAYSNMGAAYQSDGEATVANEGRDCVNLDAENFLRKLCSLPNLQSKVLMSTRLRPRSVEANRFEVIQGCLDKELTQMQPADAVAFFRALGIRGNRNEIEQACGAYGFHPLSLRLLAGLVVNDFYNPGDIQAAQALDVSGELVQRQHHVLEQSYSNLSKSGRQLLNRIACFRSPVEIVVIEQIERGVKQLEIEAEQQNNAETSETTPKLSVVQIAKIKQVLQATLQDLMARGLVQREGSQFDLHPIVRRYAYDRMTEQARSNTHSQLRDYFAAVPPANKVTTLDDLAPTVELYYHMVRAGQYDEAWKLFCDRLEDVTYLRLGAYQLRIELLCALFSPGEIHLPQLSNQHAQAYFLITLANSYSLYGQPVKAMSLQKQAVTIQERIGDIEGLAITISNLALDQSRTGALLTSETNLKHQIQLGQNEIENRYDMRSFSGSTNNSESCEAIGYAELGRLYAYRGKWVQARTTLDRALMLFNEIHSVQYKAITWSYHALTSRLELRSHSRATSAWDKQIQSILIAARQALELTDRFANSNYPIEREYIRVNWMLGVAYLVKYGLTGSDYHNTFAFRHLTSALRRCRTINSIDAEADILLDLARLHCDQGNAAESLRLAQEALIITNRSGYVLQGADVNLFLAEQALAEGDEAKARAYANTARELATCDGGEYTYKVAYEEAGALLAELG